MKTKSILTLLAVLFLYACNNTKKDETNTENNSAVAQPPAAGEETGINISLYSVFMYRYEALRLLKLPSCHKLVFQFYFPPKDANKESPVLAAYPSKTKNEFLETTPTLLQYYQISGVELEGDFYLGDQQILKNENSNDKGLQNFINDELKGDDTTLLFIPAIKATDKHVYYKIYAVPDPNLKKLSESEFVRRASIITNPSPPAKAD